jgi:large subunit ribosomal protein L2
MGIRRYKPTTPGRRGSSGSDYSELTRSRPEKALTKPVKSSGGRNAHGRTTARYRGGGNKRRYRVVDFRRNKDGIPARVFSIEYDPNRAAALP